ncbi:glycine--tRNA ligase subunit beta [Lacticaseibacillus camelliae]|uniref:Glycine--tRNA ligase beta subunit n=1 Tax=Lacticaseibacillus camelliae DSM 22697 = JCM 13995 TaxID=1423730 RepID=A0A0R2F725_9LACO|nr:glycine--tRNA ligase subunit beta [Lacticaseibacillus camelliae]KRN22181.1 glycyl-tRNA synthetase subunit beta [Lacticaseibacillus camelliae DSM 22697 = JCM 13995]
MATYLLEIGLEDMPAHVVTPSVNQFAQKAGKFLKDNHLDYETINTYSTPRRLTIEVLGLADKQADTEEDVKGPAKKIAQDADGNWSKAAIGFTRGQGMTVDDIEFRELKGVEYVYLHKQTAGKPAAEILPGLIDVVKGLTFPTRMKWGNYDFEYIRPIHWLVSLLDDQVVPMQLLDIKAGRRTEGHRFLGHAIDLKQAGDYVEALRGEKVLVDAAERKALIRQQIAQIATDNHWKIDLDADLLEEVNNLVEWPTAFAGRFDQKYLDIPEPVLITSMKDNQRYFYARDADGKMVNAFIGVRNGNTEHLDNVIRGNVKVLTARLEDAAFFYAEDQKKTIAQFVERLKTVSFHDKIGSMTEKMARVGTIAGLLADHVGLAEADKQKLLRAAAIYKFDLVSAMVGEFAELQGVMGEVYAKLAGEDPVVAQAIREHYEPISADGALPESEVGTLLAIADKLDSIMSFFAVDLIPTGSNDPYALRRQAYGIVRMVAANHIGFDISALQKQVVAKLTQNDQLAGLDWEKNQTAVADFFRDRVGQFLSTGKIRHDILDAVQNAPTVDVEGMIAAAKILTAHQDDADFKPTMEALGRVLRIADKSPQNVAVDVSLFENSTEKSLHDAVSAVKAHFDAQPSEANYQALRGLTDVITDYFTETMIMADDERVRTNRLAELTGLANLIHQFGDITAVIVK